jgi:hypothetical protein
MEHKVDAFIVTLGGANGQTEMCSSGDPEERPYRLGTCGSHDPSTGITVTVKAQALRSAETGASIPPTGKPLEPFEAVPVPEEDLRAQVARLRAALPLL